MQIRGLFLNWTTTHDSVRRARTAPNGIIVFERLRPMAIKGTRFKIICPLDGNPYQEMVHETGVQARESLAMYGEPRVSLGELRTALEGHLPGRSLTEWVLKEREASL